MRRIRRSSVNPNCRNALTHSSSKRPVMRRCDRLLRRIHKYKSNLLLVLERAEIPLHSNGSERDICDHVKKQKISGGMRSELGRRCRDTLSSLKKTCRKLGISFWDYLADRISHTNCIPLLPHILEQRIALST
ncbi:transposase [Cupriavidus basilensis]|nr:transposase [Cupriavidus basilensis]MDF3888307.1 transposase [Cupriavidus basilensis]